VGCVRTCRIDASHSDPRNGLPWVPRADGCPFLGRACRPTRRLSEWTCRDSLTCGVGECRKSNSCAPLLLVQSANDLLGNQPEEWSQVRRSREPGPIVCGTESRSSPRGPFWKFAVSLRLTVSSLSEARSNGVLNDERSVSIRSAVAPPQLEEPSIRVCPAPAQNNQHEPSGSEEIDGKTGPS
jgi:hypothetical protein